MRAALAYELMRIRTLRSTWWITGIGLGLGLVVTGLAAWGLDSDSGHLGPLESADQVGAALVTQFAGLERVPSVVAYVLAVIGILAWGHEYRYGVVRTSLTALGSRSAFWVAKYVVVLSWVAVSTFLTAVLSGLVALVFAHHWLHVFTALTWRTIGLEVLYVVLLTMLAMAFTAVTRSQVLAIVMIFLWPMFIEPVFHLLFVVVPSWRDNLPTLRFLPFEAGKRIVSLLGSGTSTFGDPLSVLGGTLVFGGLAVLLALVSYVLVLRRDA